MSDLNRYYRRDAVLFKRSDPGGQAARNENVSVRINAGVSVVTEAALVFVYTSAGTRVAVAREGDRGEGAIWVRSALSYLAISSGVRGSGTIFQSEK